MSHTIRIRNVPDALYRELEARAARAGMTLSDYLLAEIGRAVERPPVAELRRRLGRRKAVRTREPIAEAVRAERARGLG